MLVPKIKLSVKFSQDFKQSELPKINCSHDAYNILQKCFDEDTFLIQEQFIVIMVNNSNNVIGYYQLSSGGITSTVVDIRLLFATAIKSLATGIILAHNHPSGQTRPSQADIEITKKIKKAGEVLDIKLLDHLILTHETYFSFQDEGYF